MERGACLLVALAQALGMGLSLQQREGLAPVGLWVALELTKAGALVELALALLEGEQWGALWEATVVGVGDGCGQQFELARLAQWWA